MTKYPDKDLQIKMGGYCVACLKTRENCDCLEKALENIEEWIKKDKYGEDT